MIASPITRKLVREAIAGAKMARATGDKTEHRAHLMTILEFGTLEDLSTAESRPVESEVRDQLRTIFGFTD